MTRTRILGLDPSLVACGWGIVDMSGSKITHIGHGVIRPPKKESLAKRLSFLYAAIEQIISDAQPDTAGVEEAFMKDNAMSALKLGHARAVCLLAPSRAGLSVGEYSARSVKKSVTGTGAADKAQVAAMINVLLPGCAVKAGDAADALAIAICHGHHRPPDLRAVS
ncbi:crossover junction endodeoxyribonuclease RuvC [Robiginitomaculum antarcticum]|uniref:crossover junction endodeoxyribonuclease RuvC n=1 Tax=Robiginitomaculum antarcticum TaxID=437507 RepID=UPI001F1AD538|nr:crossover junction endodeoxyribonuclease RuvC [Robiginitomaculum antarcticum]